MHQIDSLFLKLTDALADVLMNRVCICSGGREEGVIAAGVDGAMSGCGLNTSSTSVTSSNIKIQHLYLAH